MRGHNELFLCPAEMFAAIEYYLQEVVFKDKNLVVVGVKESQTTEHSGMFKIVLQEVEEEQHV